MSGPLHYARCGAALALASAALLVAACSKAPSKQPRPPVPVTVAPARRAAVPYTITAHGIVTPVQTATVAPQVDGLVTGVPFREGQNVVRGQLLFRIDPRPYVAAYDQAQATLARDRATAANAQRELARYDTLARAEYVTQEQADQQRTTASAAEATVRADEAAVATAKFNLDNTTVRAPIAGRTGSLLVRTGNIVHAAATTPLVVINQINPILVRFAVPGTELPLIQRYGAGRPLPVRVVPSAAPADAAGGDTLASPDPAPPGQQSADVPQPRSLTDIPGVEGTLSFIDNAVDTTTGTVMLKATFPNMTGTLWAGEFVSVSLRLFVEPNALVVPAPAVLRGQQGTYVYVVDSTGAARQRKVAIERPAEGLVVIASGLRDGERVVTDGQSRLTPGARVAARSAPDSTNTRARSGP